MHSNLEQLILLQMRAMQLFIFAKLLLEFSVLDRQVINDASVIFTVAQEGVVPYKPSTTL